MINHFKSHIVEFYDGKFAVRKLKVSLFYLIFNYRYYDTNEPLKFNDWGTENMEYISLDSLEKAKSLLLLISPRIKKIYENPFN